MGQFFRLTPPSMRAGVCEICLESFEKMCPQSVKKPTLCAKESCLKQKKRLNYAKYKKRMEQCG